MKLHLCLQPTPPHRCSRDCLSPASHQISEEPEPDYELPLRGTQAARS